tara:strand:- start:1121 stop:1297 length:177 start_codon:yes stop_codon:yes gene_type:complete
MKENKMEMNNMNDENKYKKLYNCTRNQYRRIIQGAPYNAGLDGAMNEYNKRKKLIMEE